MSILARLDRRSRNERRGGCGDERGPIGAGRAGSLSRAVLAKDVEAFVALYDADVRIFDPFGAWSHRGIDAWRHTWRGGSAP
jgi:hypothetical protein